MRKAAYTILLKAPARIGAGCVQLLSIAATVWPDAIKRWVHDSMTAEHIRVVAFICSAILGVYWLLLWRFRPSQQDSAKAIGQTGANNAQIFGPVHAPVHVGDVHNYGSERNVRGATAIPDNLVVLEGIGEGSAISVKRTTGLEHLPRGFARLQQGASLTVDRCDIRETPKWPSSHSRLYKIPKKELLNLAEKDAALLTAQQSVYESLSFANSIPGEPMPFERNLRTTTAQLIGECIRRIGNVDYWTLNVDFKAGLSAVVSGTPTGHAPFSGAPDLLLWLVSMVPDDGEKANE